VIAGVIDSPAADVYSSPILRELVQQYYEDADAFDRAMAGTPTSA
jgi:hypothetical protein